MKYRYFKIRKFRDVKCNISVKREGKGIKAIQMVDGIKLERNVISILKSGINQVAVQVILS